MTKRTLTAIVILMLASAAFADGLFLQSQMYPAQTVQSFEEQLGLAKNAVTNPLEDIDDYTAEYAVAKASGSLSYPVTPGDVYTLTYYSGTNIITESITVDSKVNVQVPFVGQINANGMTFIDFKDYVEKTVTGLYSYSKPQLSIKRCGTIYVNISGAVKYSRDVQVFGFARLSDLAMYATDFASTRKIYITYSDGTQVCCDLFSAMMNSDTKGNPLLKPECSVKFVPAETTVTLNGKAKRTGTFQTLEGQNLSDLISQYGLGLQTGANIKQAAVTRFSDGTFQTDLVELQNAEGYTLQNGDSVQIMSANQDMPYVVVEGALTLDKTDTTSPKNASTRIFYQFFPGETSSQLITNMASKFIQSSDTAGIYLTRANGEVIDLHADEVLTAKPTVDVPLMQGDVVTVPFTRQTVTVSGGVVTPGSYAYVAGKDYKYYINQAGGYSADARKLMVTATNNEGSKVRLADAIGAGSVISVPKRNTNMASDIALVVAALGLGVSIYTFVTGYSNVAHITK